MDNDNELPMLLERASFWYYSQEEQCFIPTILKQRYYVSVGALVSLHPHLPEAIHALMVEKENKREAEPRADGLLVRNTAKLLTNGMISLTDTAGKHYQMVEVIGMIRVDADNTVALWGEHIGIKYKVKDGQDIPFVHTRANVHMHIDQAQLNSQFPGCLDRLATGRALGLESRELARFTLVAQDTPVPAFPADAILFA